jgi:GntR family histidine utilization transcriptional repressor
MHSFITLLSWNTRCLPQLNRAICVSRNTFWKAFARRNSCRATIPPELELASQFSVSRMTVNKAVRDLAEAGILLRFAGDGTYVAERKAESPLLDINNIAAEVEARGHTHSADVHQLETIAAGEEIALQLGVKVGTPIYHSILVHREDGLPIQLEDRYVNPAWAPDYILQDFHPPHAQ